MGKRFFVCLFMSLNLVACHEDPPKHFVVGTTPDAPPFEYVETGNGLVGFEIDLVNLISTQTLNSASFKTETADNLIPELLSGQINMVASSFSPSQETDENVAFTRTFYAPPFYVVQKEDRSSLEECLNQRMGAHSNNNAITAVIPIFRNHLNVSVITKDNTANLLHLLNSGGCDFVLLDQKDYRNAKTDIEKLKLHARSFDHPYDPNGFTPINDFMKADTAALRQNRGFAFAIRKNDIELLGMLNSTLDKLDNNRAIEALLDKWGLL